jgi:hypothetical protein
MIVGLVRSPINLGLFTPISQIDNVQEGKAGWANLARPIDNGGGGTEEAMATCYMYTNLGAQAVVTGLKPSAPRRL